ncbi:BMP-binding endothelial regulator protein-like [Ptychodera flava]|uniref:BMP-binding endothelial regulator protein-like n=1 Tax=Ptychodera flava TaxID=63121 RepID=UPI00396AAC4E
MPWIKVLFVVCTVLGSTAFGGKHRNQDDEADKSQVEVYDRQVNTCHLCSGQCRTQCEPTERTAAGYCQCPGGRRCCVDDESARDCVNECNGICRYLYCPALEMEAPSACKCGGQSKCCIDDPTAVPCGDCSGICRDSCRRAEMEAPSGCTCGLGRKCCMRLPSVPDCLSSCGGECRVECLFGEMQPEGPCFCPVIGGQEHKCCAPDPDIQVCDGECGGDCTYYGCDSPEHQAPDNCQCATGSLGDRLCCLAPEDATALPSVGPTRDGSGRGDPHFDTFDNKKYSFQGNCAYTLVMDCVNEQPNFVVLIKNVAGTFKDQHVSRIGAVYVNVSSYNIELHQDLILLVNEGYVSPVSLPLVLMVPDGQIVNITTSESSLSVSIFPDIIVSWDGDRYVDVKISPQLAGNVCGLLGNGDGIRGDDYVDRDGNKMATIQAFVNAWVVPDSC